MKRRRTSVTLLELLIAIVILSLLVLGFFNLDAFARFQVMTADRRAKLQNDAAYVLEHMVKEISKAIGDINQPPISVSSIGADLAIIAWVDTNQNGMRDAADRQLAYRFTGTNGNPSDYYQIWYYPDYVNPSSAYQVVSRNITGFVRSTAGNYVDMQITACWDPDGNPVACGSSDNPRITLLNRIGMPSVSTN